MYRFVFSALALALLVSCKPSYQPESTSGPVLVVVTNSILADAVKNLTEGLTTPTEPGTPETLRVVTLIGPDGDPHTYEPTPADMKAVADATVFIESGLDLEPWSEKFLQASGSSALHVIATDGIKPLKLRDSSDHEGHAHRDVDPHVWNDVENYITMTKNLEKALVKADPAHAKIYKDNADKYLKKLKDLDDWVKEQVTSLPKEKRKLVTNHDVFQYFANRYGFEILGNALGSITTESQDPSAAYMVKLTVEIKTSGVKTIFGDFSSNPKLIEQIANEAGVKIGPKLFVDSLGSPGTEGDSYEKMMRYNISSIVDNLK